VLSVSSPREGTEKLCEEQLETMHVEKDTDLGSCMSSYHPGIQKMGHRRHQAPKKKVIDHEKNLSKSVVEPFFYIFYSTIT
jgi:hypothetical protein